MSNLIWHFTESIAGDMEIDQSSPVTTSESVRENYSGDLVEVLDNQDSVLVVVEEKDGNTLGEDEIALNPDTWTSCNEKTFANNVTAIVDVCMDNNKTTVHQEDLPIVSHELRLSSLCSLQLETETFFKGCKWAPDGLCIMSCSNDNVIRLINTPKGILDQKWHEAADSEVLSCLDVKEAEIVYDYAWWPHMNSMHPNTCCFVSTAKDQPVHLWDAFNGKLRASYIAKNQVDEVSAANCLGFSPDGMQLVCGFSKCLRLFYIDKPGTCCETWPTRKHKKATGQRGIISTCEFSPDGDTIACGSYDGTVGLYSSKNGDLIGIFNSSNKGITQVQFSLDGNRVYAGSRMDNSIICWDLRYMAQDLFHLSRKVTTNQRIYFDTGSRACPKKEAKSEDILVSGSTDGTVLFWDVTKANYIDHSEPDSLQMEPCLSHQAHSDCVNGVSIHPFLPVIATSSGQRHYQSYSYDCSDSDCSEPEVEENCLKFWHVANWKT